MLLLMTTSPCLNAQKKEIAQARAYIKSGKNLDKAEESMRKLLTDSSNAGNVKIYMTLAESVKKQYEQINEKLYLRQPYDTAAFFNTAGRMFAAFEKLDSVLVKQGRQDPRMRNTSKHTGQTCITEGYISLGTMISQRLFRCFRNILTAGRSHCLPVAVLIQRMSLSLWRHHVRCTAATGCTTLPLSSVAGISQ